MAAYDISNVKCTDFAYSFVDCNIWFAYLSHFRAEGASNQSVKNALYPDNHYYDYMQWIEDVIDANEKGNPDNDPSILHSHPKIIFTSLLATEIVNAYSRKISQKIYQIETGDSSKTFKQYRKEPHYRRELGMLVDDIVAYKNYCLTQNDDFRNLDFFNTIKSFTNDFDFNDYFYMNSCLIADCPIVTHDGDFTNPYNTILTKNRRILNPPRRSSR